MKIHFIGTGSGKTSLKRFHSSFLISENDNTVLVDCGDGISRAILTQGISYLLIDSIIISHLHPDHYSGLPLLISQMKMYRRVNELKIFIHDSSLAFIKNIIEQSYLFEGKLGFRISYFALNHDEEFSLTDSMRCISKQNSHLNKYIKYDTENNLSLMSSSFLFRTEKTSVLYTGDAGNKNDLKLFDSKQYEYLICEVTHIPFNDLLLSISPDELKKIYITHISDEEELSISNSINSLPSEIEDKIIIASDGFTANL